MTGLEQPRVGCDDISLLNQQDVARNHIGSGNALSHAIPNDVGMRCRHLAQCSHRLLRPRLLDVAHQRVEQHNGEIAMASYGNALLRSRIHIPAEISAAMSNRMTRTFWN